MIPPWLIEKLKEKPHSFLQELRLPLEEYPEEDLENPESSEEDSHMIVIE